MIYDKKYIIPHIYDPQLKAHQIFDLLNATAKQAMEQQSPWLSIISQNAMLQKLFYRGKVPITQFINNSDIGFNEEQHKLEEERSKERNLPSWQFRQQMSLHKELLRNWTQPTFKKRDKPVTQQGLIKW